MRSQGLLQRWTLLLCLVALGGRAAWIPAHLAHEAHLGSLAVGSVPHHDHGHDHEDHGHGVNGEEPHHAPHPAVDHELTFTSRSRASAPVLFLALPPEGPVRCRPAGVVLLAAAPSAPTPRRRPPGPEQTRAPPSC